MTDSETPSSEESVEELRAGADAGDASAQYRLGPMYANGRDVPQDDTEAIHLFQLASGQGHADAQFTLGRMYDYGSQVLMPDAATAAEWYRAAAKQGDAEAQYNLGTMYSEGRGVPQDDGQTAEQSVKETDSSAVLSSEQNDADTVQFDSAMYLFFDTETTGLPRNWNAPVNDLDNWPRLVELAWLLCDETGNAVESRSAIVKPNGFEIPAQATAVHRIDTARALAQGVALSPLLDEFARVVDISRVLVAHNMSFDEKIIGAELLRAGVWSKFDKRERFCTMKASTDLCAIPSRYGFKWPKLSELHQKLFGTIPDDAHAAGADVQACARCFFEMKRLNLISQQ